MAAASLRDEEEIAGSLEELSADREQWEAAVTAASTATTPEAESAGAEADDAEKAAAEDKAAADKAAADKAAAEKAAAEDKAAAEKAAADKAAAERTAALNAPLPDPKGAVSGALAGVLCADNTRIVVDASLGGAVQSLIDDARAAGVGICAKSAFRSYHDQVALRRQNCGASDYAIYQAPPSTCSPPTARPGTSNHEGGLAVDFSCDDGQPMTHASPCFVWLDAHAGDYGLYNLPSEPWHWSVTGR
jgi:LAS superfamily LD-carboxypeptidase LdcB